MACNDARQAPTLRPYQETDVARIRAAFANGARRVCYQAPTGSGKTVLFAAVVAGATARGNRTVILGHRDEIVQQVDAALDALGIAHGIIAAGHCEAPDLPVQVASVATLVRRLDKLAPPDLIVPDECHHAAAPTWRRILDAYPNSRVLGTTATPLRLDGKGLDDIFNELVVGPAIETLIKAGYLSRFATFAPARAPSLAGIHIRAGDYAVDELAQRMSTGVIINTAVDEYLRLCSGVPAIAFCVDIAHSKLVAEAFTARGIRAAHVDGKTPREERRRMIAALGTGEIQVLTNCGLISEGLDVRAVVAAILLRPTKSLALYLQQVGRALRPAPGKERALILDHSGNTFRFGPADAPREWSLAGKVKDEPPPLQRCPECGALVPIALFECDECGAVLRQRLPPAGTVPPRRHHEIAGGRLIETDRLAVMRYGDALRWAGADEHRLRLVAKARGYKPGWIWHRLQELRAGEP
jgi:DNA repair protein RadD